MTQAEKQKERARIRAEWIAAMSDQELENTAATLVYILLGPRALVLLTKATAREA